MIIERFEKHLALLTALAVAATLGCGKNTPAKSESSAGFLDYGAMRAEAVRQVQSGQIVPDASGAADLPSSLRMVSADQKVYVAHTDEAGLAVAFSILPKQGFGQGMLYCERTPGQKIQVGPFNLRIRKNAGDHWYQVLQ